MIKPNGFIHIILVVVITLVAALMVGAAWYFEENKEVTTTNNTNITNADVINEHINESSVVIDGVSNTTPNLAFVDSKNVYSINFLTGDVVTLAKDVDWFDISENGKYLVYTRKIGDNGNSINIYDIGKSKNDQITSIKNAIYDDVIISPNNLKLAYVKKIFDNSTGMYLNQGVYVNEIDGSNEKFIVSPSLKEEEVRQYFDEKDPCSFARDVNLINVDQWSPESDYLVYTLTNGYECSGPGRFNIEFAHISDGTDFIKRYLINPGTFTFDGKQIDWQSWNISWPRFAQKNGNFLLEQHAPIPMGNNRRIIVDNGNVKTELYNDDPYAPGAKQEIQQIRESFDYYLDITAWDEWTNYSGSSTAESKVNEVVVMRKPDGTEVRFQKPAESFAYTDPLILTEKLILYKKYSVTPKTNDSGYTYTSKSDAFDLIIRNIETGKEQVVKQGIKWSDIHLYRQYSD